jgi:hypothetical protein
MAKARSLSTVFKDLLALVGDCLLPEGINRGAFLQQEKALAEANRI